MSYSFTGRYYNKYKPFYNYSYDDYFFKIDLEFGELYFERRLLQFSDSHMPFDLSLVYIQRHTLNHDFDADTGFPRGFKTNYHLFLEYDSNANRYLFEDALGFQHIFVLSINSSTLYFDSFGSGLMLISTLNGFKVFDDEENYYLFDERGRLEKIHKRITDTYFLEQTIFYLDNSLRISSIVDAQNRVVVFNYSGSSITVCYHNNVVIELLMNQTYITEIKKKIDNFFVSDSFTQLSFFIEGMSLHDGVNISLNYYGDKVLNFITNIDQDQFSFQYFLANKKTVVANSTGAYNVFDYNNNQSVIESFDGDLSIDYLKIKSNIASCVVKSSLDNQEIIEFKFNNSTTASLNSHSTLISDLAVNNNVVSNKMYLLCVEIYGNLAEESFLIQLIENNNYLLGELEFNGKTNILCFPIGIKNILDRTYTLHCFNNSPNSISIESAKLIPLIGEFELLSTNINSGGSCFYYNSESLYSLKNYGIAYINNNTNLDNSLSICPSDFIMNERLFYKRDNTFNFWTNDFKKLISGISSIIVTLPNGYYISFDSAFDSVRLLDSNMSFLENVKFFKISGNEDNCFAITEFSHNSSSFETGYDNAYFKKDEIRYVAGGNSYRTLYYYDKGDHLLEKNCLGLLKEQFTYDCKANLINEKLSDTTGISIIKSYEYDNLNNLILSNQMIGDSFEDTLFEYDDFGNLMTIEHPNAMEEENVYDSGCGQRLNCVMFDDGNSTITQTNLYVSGSNYKYIENNNNFSFIKTNGKITSISYNNQLIASITYDSVVDTDTGIVSLIGVTVEYSNNDSFSYEKDKCGRIIKKGSLEYEYDGNNNVTAIIDNSIHDYCPYTEYFYNYYDYVTEIVVAYTNLSVFFEYDMYNRLLVESYIKSSILYTVEYTYQNSLMLETVVNSSTISIGTNIITTNKSFDAFSRVTSSVLTVPNGYFSRTISYYTNYANTNTNYMVKTVFYHESVQQIGPFPTPVIEKSDNYSYDEVGNIIKIERKIANIPLYSITYSYDSFSRIIRENNYPLGKTFVYSYDLSGNVLCVEEYSYTTNVVLSNPISVHTFTYNSTFPNRLMDYDGELFAYDSIGNPTLFRNKQIFWVNGTLPSQIVDGLQTISLEYNGFNERICKTVGNVITDYFYINKKLLIEEKNNQRIVYLYSQDEIIGFFLNNTLYFYEKNIQNDVVSIRNLANEVVAIYLYDSWGNSVVLNPDSTINTNQSFIGNINPIRYRSYYYDVDLRMYWVTTRYYDPQIRRFISPDEFSYLSLDKINGTNLYSYSRNNPVMVFDPTGHSWILIGLFVLIGALLSVTLKSDSVQPPPSRIFEPSEEDKKTFKDDPFIGEDFVIYYKINVNEKEPNKTELIILDSWRYGEKEILIFLNSLKKTYNNLNVEKVLNEWLWHNFAYNMPIPFYPDQTRCANIYLNHDDEGHGIFSFIMNHIKYRM